MSFPLTIPALNHLLSQNSWALPRLARFAGKSIRFDVAPFSVVYAIQEGGLLKSADPEPSPDAHCEIAPSLLPRLALRDEKANAEIKTSGDADLLAEIFYLSRHLQWDPADDLIRYTGDIAAERIVQAMRTTQQHLREGALNFAHALAEYWTEEQPLIAKPQQVSDFMHKVDTLRNDAARLEQRIKALSPPATLSPPAISSGQAKPSPVSGRGG